jgi:hypothetical protein
VRFSAGRETHIVTCGNTLKIALSHVVLSSLDKPADSTSFMHCPKHLGSDPISTTIFLFLFYKISKIVKANSLFYILNSNLRLGIESCLILVKVFLLVFVEKHVLHVKELAP